MFLSLVSIKEGCPFKPFGKLGKLQLLAFGIISDDFKAVVPDHPPTTNPDISPKKVNNLSSKDQNHL